MCPFLAKSTRFDFTFIYFTLRGHFTFPSVNVNIVLGSRMLTKRWSYAVQYLECKLFRED